MPNSTLPIRNTAIPTTDPEAGLKVTEIFYSLQGEALTAGLPTIFIRLTGCPLRCVYCHNPDTMEMRRGRDIELEEIERLLRRYRRVFRATGGGITLSGGEVLMQPAFARNVLREKKLDEAYAQWAQEVRGRAWVEFREPPS